MSNMSLRQLATAIYTPANADGTPRICFPMETGGMAPTPHVYDSHGELITTIDVEDITLPFSLYDMVFRQVGDVVEFPGGFLQLVSYEKAIHHAKLSNSARHPLE
jgi:hypothetical protein